jgi:hypothetical protein
MKSKGTVIYTTELQAKSNKMGWGVGSQQITKFIKSDGNTINIIYQYGQIDTAVLQARCKKLLQARRSLFQSVSKAKQQDDG